jgi:inner membrane protein
VTGEFTPIFNDLGELTTFASFRLRSQFLSPFCLTRRAETAYGGQVPSPVGHLLGGAIAGYAIAPSAVLLCAIAGAAPDVDFLWGRHNQATHSLFAAVLAGLAVLAWKRDARVAIAVTVAWTSHVLFDWLGSDTTPPLGVMALWPFSSEYYFSNAFFFEAISRRYWLDNFVTHNVWAVAKELLILGPPLALLTAFRWRERRRSRRPGRA